RAGRPAVLERLEIIIKPLTQSPHPPNAPSSPPAHAARRAESTHASAQTPPHDPDGPQSTRHTPGASASPAPAPALHLRTPSPPRYGAAAQMTNAAARSTRLTTFADLRTPALCTSPSRACPPAHQQS